MTRSLRPFSGSDVDAERIQSAEHITQENQAATAIDAGLNSRQREVLRLQQTSGNSAVMRMLKSPASRIQSRAVQREDADDDPTSQASDDSTDDPSSELQPNPYQSDDDEHTLDDTIEVEKPEPIELPQHDDPQPGDYPTPNDPNNVMAKRLESAAVVQRDDVPHPSADFQNQNTWGIVRPPGTPLPVPWSLQITGIYRNLNLAQIKTLHLDLGHEPNISFTGDVSKGLSTQFAMSLINWHWMPPWNRELEVGLSGLATYSLLPKLSSLYGGQLQAEQHIVPWFSVTLNVSGYAVPPQGGNPGQFAMTAGTSALIHFDGF